MSKETKWVHPEEITESGSYLCFYRIDWAMFNQYFDSEKEEWFDNEEWEEVQNPDAVLINLPDVMDFFYPPVNFD